MTDQITRLLDQIDRLDQEATPGPWVANDLGIGYEITTQQQIDEAAEMNDWPMPINSGIKDTFPRSDAEFIALARTFTPALSRAVRAVLKECDRFQKNATALHENPLADHSDNVRADAWRVMAAFITEEITDALGADDAQ